MAKVWVDKNLCIACGSCIAIAPEIFEWDTDGKSKAKISEINDQNLLELAKNAQMACPTGAIKIEE
mgnify:CR=1 FL=1